MRLFQWNPRIAWRITLQIFAIFALTGVLYHTRGGYELTSPDDPPEFSPPAEQREGIHPKVCVGYLPNVKPNPSTDIFGYTYEFCPDNHVILATSDLAGPHKTGPGRYVGLHGLCCPLPADDILTDEHIYSEQEDCPEQYVATGGAGKCEDNCTMRCTKINTKKYKISNQRVSYYVKFKDAGRLFGQGDTDRIFWSQIPISLRYGALRVSAYKWTGDGCIGMPFGTMLTSKRGKRCDGYFFSELQYLDGIPVKMFPECDAISDIYSSTAHCLRGAEASEAIEPVILRQ